MKQLLTNYSLDQILLFIVILAIAIKQVVTFFFWSISRTKQALENQNKPEEMINIANKHETELNEIRNELNTLKDQIQLLIQSDRDDIKHSITKDHHYFCYKLKSIDDYSLDCIEKKFQHYVDEGGNTFVAALMQDLRNLPRRLDKDNR